jgi:hypothetical protein
MANHFASDRRTIMEESFPRIVKPVDFLFPVAPGSASGLTREEAIDQHKCVMCDTEGPVDFRDRESVAEYHISGMCQNCQDEFYVEALQAAIDEDPTDRIR